MDALGRRGPGNGNAPIASTEGGRGSGPCGGRGQSKLQVQIHTPAAAQRRRCMKTQGCRSEQVPREPDSPSSFACVVPSCTSNVRLLSNVFLNSRMFMASSSSGRMPTFHACLNGFTKSTNVLCFATWRWPQLHNGYHTSRIPHLQYSRFSEVVKVLYGYG